MFNNPGRLLDFPETDASTLWHEGLAATLEEIDGPQVAVLRDVPYQRRSPDKCLSMHLEDASACAVPREEAFRENLMAAEDAAIAEAGDDVHGVDFTRYFCNAETCPTVIGSTAVFRQPPPHPHVQRADERADVGGDRTAGEVNGPDTGECRAGASDIVPTGSRCCARPRDPKDHPWPGRSWFRAPDEPVRRSGPRSGRSRCWRPAPAGSPRTPRCGRTSRSRPRSCRSPAPARPTVCSPPPGSSASRWTTSRTPPTTRRRPAGHATGRNASTPANAPPSCSQRPGRPARTARL